MTSSKATIVELSEASYIREAVYNGVTLRLYARPVDVALYPDVKTFYSVPVTRGEKKGDTEMFITVDDYLENKPARQGKVSQKEKFLALKAENLSDSEILARLFS